MDPSNETVGWVRVPYLEEEDGQEVAGAFVHLPVTILRASGRQVSLVLWYSEVQRTVVGMLNYDRKAHDGANAIRFVAGELGRDSLGRLRYRGSSTYVSRVARCKRQRNETMLQRQRVSHVQQL